MIDIVHRLRSGYGFMPQFSNLEAHHANLTNVSSHIVSAVHATELTLESPFMLATEEMVTTRMRIFRSMSPDPHVVVSSRFVETSSFVDVVAPPIPVGVNHELQVTGTVTHASRFMQLNTETNLKSNGTAHELAIGNQLWIASVGATVAALRGDGLVELTEPFKGPSMTQAHVHIVEPTSTSTFVIAVQPNARRLADSTKVRHCYRDSSYNNMVYCVHPTLEVNEVRIGDAVVVGTEEHRIAGDTRFTRTAGNNVSQVAHLQLLDDYRGRNQTLPAPRQASHTSRETISSDIEDVGEGFNVHRMVAVAGQPFKPNRCCTLSTATEI
jgi:hypothetical protein